MLWLLHTNKIGAHKLDSCVKQHTHMCAHTSAQSPLLRLDNNFVFLLCRTQIRLGWVSHSLVLCHTVVQAGKRVFELIARGEISISHQITTGTTPSLIVCFVCFVCVFVVSISFSSSVSYKILSLVLFYMRCALFVLLHFFFRFFFVSNEIVVVFWWWCSVILISCWILSHRSGLSCAVFVRVVFFYVLCLWILVYSQPAARDSFRDPCLLCLKCMLFGKFPAL